MFKADNNAEIRAPADPGRQRRNSLLLVLALGLCVFGAIAGALYYALQPVTLRIAVGPPGSDDEKLIRAMARVFSDERGGIRLAPVTTPGARESLALLGSSKADLAVGRADLDMPGNAETVAIVRKNFVVLWSAPAVRSSASKTRRPSKISEIGDLAGHRVGVIGRTDANINLLRIILGKSGVAPEKVAVSQFGTDQLDVLARDPTIDAFMAVGPLDSQISSGAIAATEKARGAPKFLAIDVSEAIALKHPLYESEEIPQGAFNSAPAWPPDKVETVSVNHLIVAQKSLSESTVATFARQLFSLRQSIAKQAPGAAHIKKPDTDKDAELPVHRGAAAYIDGNERTFLDKYGDYFWFALLLLSALGSAAAWGRHFLKRNERRETTFHRNKIMNMVSQIRAVGSIEDLSALQHEVDEIIHTTIRCYDDGALDEEDLAVFGLALELFHNAAVERRAELETGGALPALRRVT